MTLNNLIFFFAINLDHIYVLEQIPISLRSWDLDYPDCSNQANLCYPYGCCNWVFFPECVLQEDGEIEAYPVARK